MNDQQQLEQLKRRVENSMQPRWLGRLDERQQKLVSNCRLYAANNPGGLPGHNLMIIIARLADLLGEYEEPVKLDVV